MRITVHKWFKIIIISLVIVTWGYEFINHSLVGQVKAQDGQFVDPEELFDQYMENFDREATVLEKSVNKNVTREAIAEDIAIEAAKAGVAATVAPTVP